MVVSLSNIFPRSKLWLRHLFLLESNHCCKNYSNTVLLNTSASSIEEPNESSIAHHWTEMIESLEKTHETENIDVEMEKLSNIFEIEANKLLGGEDTKMIEETLENIYLRQKRLKKQNSSTSNETDVHKKLLYNTSTWNDGDTPDQGIKAEVRGGFLEPKPTLSSSYQQLKYFFQKWATKPFLTSSNKSSSSHQIHSKDSNPPLLSKIAWNRITAFKHYAPVLAVLVYHKKVELAEKVFALAESQIGEEMKNSLTTAIPNMFIQAYLEHPETPQIDKAFDWYMKLEQYKLRPDVLTYAFLIRIALKFDDDSNTSTKLLVNEMNLHGITPQSLVDTGLFTDESLKLFKHVCREMNIHIHSPSSQEIKNTESKHHDSVHALIDHSHPPSSFSFSKALSSFPFLNFLNQEKKETSKTESAMGEDHIPHFDNSMDDIHQHHQVQPVQKGLKNSNDRSISSIVEAEGVYYIKRSLRALEDKLSDPYYAQQRLERDCYEASKEKWMGQVKTLTKISGVGRLHAIGALYEYWAVSFSKILAEKEEVYDKNVRSIVPQEQLDAIFSLSCLPHEKTSRIALMHFLKITHFNPEFEGYVFTKLCSDIGEALEREVFAENITKKKFLTKSGLSYEKVQQIFNSEKLLNSNMRKIYEKMESDSEALQAGWIPKWSLETKVKVGSFLAALIIQNMKLDPTEFGYIPTTSPERKSTEFAFKHELVSNGGKRYGIVRINPTLYDALVFTPDNPFVVPTALPMLIPPKLWLTYNSGGYLTFRSVCVRMKDDPLQLAFIKMASKQGTLTQLLTGLDVLGKTAWTVNSQILNIVVSAWNGGVDMSDMPKATSGNMVFQRREDFESDAAYLDYCRQLKKFYAAKRNNHSIRCDTYYKLEIANKLNGRVFYFPHNIDFRGRAYPIPTHFNHIGSDLCRGLLTFSEGKPLGEKGLWWLKIHIANLHGFDKATLDERVTFTESHLKDIFDSADHPLDGRKWWMHAEDPWQCLSASIELTAALRSDDPKKFNSHLPIHQDGSCNGLQHYAALGRDVVGADTVNLFPRNRPQDVYSVVANAVSALVDEDAKTGNEIALLLQGKITRKIVKQPIMTTVYGVTFYGAKKQIQTKLEDEEWIPEDKIEPCSRYITTLVFKSLGSIFDKARAIQNWLMETATEVVSSVPLRFAKKYGWREELQVAWNPPPLKLKTWNPIKTVLKEREGEGTTINNSSSSNSSKDSYPQNLMMWTTPLGFPVAQPYRSHQVVNLKTSMQSVTVHVKDEHLAPVTLTKQVAGFPPNFIHSLDACHMLMTAMGCYEAGLTFASVHDSFWTHACDVDKLSLILREKFIHLHEKPILEDLRAELLERYGDYKVPVMVPLSELPPEERAFIKRSKRATTATQGDDEDEDDTKENLLFKDSENVTEEPKGEKTVYRPYWKAIRIPELPGKGDFDLNQVLKSTYFFN